jgi:hypothetical protein
MCKQQLSDKGWLRQYWPQFSQAQLERFIGLVVEKLDYITEPTDRQTEAARSAALRDMTGAVE